MKNIILIALKKKENQKNLIKNKNDIMIESW